MWNYILLNAAYINMVLILAISTVCIRSAPADWHRPMQLSLLQLHFATI